ncbi:MAG: flagellar brake domain-containing protein [Thermoclostridium sp.]|nr:flagellar brake domain-containing protein [Thermoclostridium sp.]
MRYRQIGIGTKIELELYDSNGDRIRPVLVSQYEDYDEKENQMEVHVPFYEGKIYPVHPGTLMNVIFSKESDTYAFKAEAISRYIQDGIAILAVRPVSDIEKIERRSFYRMNCALEAEYRIVDTLSMEDSRQEPFIKVSTRDISGGGVCLATESKLNIETIIEAHLKLDRKIRFIGIVARSIEFREKGKILYETGIEFKFIENRDRERIISYVFESQRELLKKSWLKRDADDSK